MQSNPKDLTPDEKREIVTRIWKKNPRLGRRKIAEMTGISPSHVWNIIRKLKTDPDPYFDTEADLESWIRDNPGIVFNEKVEWLRSQIRLDKGISPDLVGFDANGNLVIVEVKLGSPDRDAVSQILDYASYLTKLPNPEDSLAYALKAFFSENALGKELRLFIVGSSFSQTVERICQYLREYGINIQHLSVGDTIKPDKIN